MTKQEYITHLLLLGWSQHNNSPTDFAKGNSRAHLASDHINLEPGGEVWVISYTTDMEMQKHMTMTFQSHINILAES